jgi:hypothetical protein
MIRTIDSYFFKNVKRLQMKQGHMQMNMSYCSTHASCSQLPLPGSTLHQHSGAFITIQAMQI